jgi:hypothetical protein
VAGGIVPFPVEERLSVQTDIENVMRIRGMIMELLWPA